MIVQSRVKIRDGETSSKISRDAFFFSDEPLHAAMLRLAEVEHKSTNSELNLCTRSIWQYQVKFCLADTVHAIAYEVK